MKKLAVFVSIVALCVLQSHAIIALSWRSDEGFLKTDGVTGILGDPSKPMNALAQLIFSPDQIHDPVDPFAPNYVSGNDVWLASYQITYAPYGEFATVYTGAYLAGYLFIRVFDQGSWGGLTNGMWYFDSPMTQTIDNLTDPLILDDFNIGPMSPGLGDILNKQVVVIPEPATWAMMLLGATALVGRKLRRK